MDLVYWLHHCDAHSLTLRVNECSLLIGGKQIAQSVLDWHNFSQVPNRPLGFLAGRPLTNSITFPRRAVCGFPTASSLRFPLP